MNFMWLDSDPVRSARYNVDKHAIKLGLEAAQVLSTAHPEEIAPYAHSHPHSPLVRWVQQSRENYFYLAEFARALFAEYTFRYGRRHKSEDTLDWLVTHKPEIPDAGLTRIPRCFAEFKGIIPETDDVVRDYRNYYCAAKRHLFRWKNREIPDWITISAPNFIS